MRREEVEEEEWHKESQKRREFVYRLKRSTDNTVESATVAAASATTQAGCEAGGDRTCSTSGLT